MICTLCGQDVPVMVIVTHARQHMFQYVGPCKATYQFVHDDENPHVIVSWLPQEVTVISG